MEADASVSGVADGADPEYRSLSGLSLVSLVLGLASPAFFAAPVLVVIPLVAIVLAIAALRAIAATPEVLTGRLPAQIGAAIAALVLGAGFTQGVVVQRLLSAQAEPVSRRWVELVTTGEVDQAFLLTLYPGNRVLDPTALVGPDGQTQAGAIQAYASRPVVVALREDHASETPRSVRLIACSEAVSYGKGRLGIAHTYEVDGGGTPRRVELSLERLPPGQGTAGRWRVIDAKFVGASRP